MGDFKGDCGRLGWVEGGDKAGCWKQQEGITTSSGVLRVTASENRPWLLGPQLSKTLS